MKKVDSMQEQIDNVSRVMKKIKKEMLDLKKKVSKRNARDKKHCKINEEYL